jgi:hypothetical protein
MHQLEVRRVQGKYQLLICTAYYMLYVFVLPNYAGADFGEHIVDTQLGWFSFWQANAG